MAPLIEEECTLCGETYPLYQTYRCIQCRRLYCKNCITYTDDNQVICLNCARRLVSPGRFTSKYAQLSIYLVRRAKYSDRVTLPFKRVEEIIGDDLPASAYYNRYWWNNTRKSSQSEAWMTVGWKVEEVDLERQEVTLRRQETARIEPQRRRRRRTSKSFKALLHKPSRRRPRKPSKTKIAIVQARAQNIMRKSSIRKYRGKFKPRKAYEKRLYKPDEKPDA